ncbi:MULTISPECIES: type II toxin-antitoxin system RelE/ParE family toxin [unclassified Bradyrhizobium]|uniref:type II toxin-antitoxin system RelE/ParE family toxin n=1 Tax=unclassified Bradyrhizobium TaxID=2631580 RepID=UPI002FF3B8C6
MKLVYSRRALADLDGISAYYAANASSAIADSVGRRLEDVIERICRVPESAPRVSQRSQVRVVTVLRYPFRIFLSCAQGHDRYPAHPTHVATAR